MLEELGFTYPEALRDAFPNEFGGQLSDEKVDALDVDALVWFADGDRTVERAQERPGLLQARRAQGGPRRLHPRQRPRLRGDLVPVGAEHAALMKELVPRLAAAADGDPATSTDQQPES